jgi:hypothetical protein
MTERGPLVVAYGAGINSTAMLVGLSLNAERPDLILFADTGGEKPETYAYLDVLGAWLTKVGFPSLVVVRNPAWPGGLEEECLAKHMLPSLAYGHRKCSDKWKRRPQDNYVAAWPPAVECWGSGGKVVKAIGYDAGEVRRMMNAEAVRDERYTYCYPLINWRWWREECVDAIQRAGLPVPPKSACFFCPASTKREIVSLQDKHPCLFRRALAMEESAKDTIKTVKGLGRRFAWSELDARQHPLPLFGDIDEEPMDEPCDCYDGERERR